MTTPAPFGRFVLAACYGVGVVQVGMLGLVALLKTAGTLASASRHGPPLPPWLGLLDLALSVVAVVWMWVMWRRGELDEIDMRRWRR